MVRHRLGFCFYLASGLLAAVLLLARQALPFSWLGSISLVPASFAVVILQASGSRLRQAGINALGFCLGLAWGGCRFWGWERQEPPTPGVPVQAVSAYQGFLSEDSTAAASGQTFYRLSLREVYSRGLGVTVRARGRVELRIPQGPKLFQGQAVRVEGALIPFPRGLGAPLICFAGAQQLCARGFSSPLLEWRAAIRRRLDLRLARLERPAGGLLAALLAGDRGGITAEAMEGFRLSGSLHVLALSGLHLGILFSGCSLLLGLLPLRGLRFPLVALLMLSYLFLVGSRPSLLRAVIMLLAGGLAELLDRDREPLNILALSGLLILFLDPPEVFSLSFQLSYLALLGILFIGGPLGRAFRPFLPGFLRAPLALSLGAQIATAPLQAMSFGVLYPAGVLAAVPIVALVTGYIWTGLAYLACGALELGWGEEACAWMLSHLYRLLLSFLNAFSRFPVLRPGTAALPWVLLAALVLPLLALQRRRSPA